MNDSKGVYLKPDIDLVAKYIDVALFLKHGSPEKLDGGYIEWEAWEDIGKVLKELGKDNKQERHNVALISGLFNYALDFPSGEFTKEHYKISKEEVKLFQFIRGCNPFGENFSVESISFKASKRDTHEAYTFTIKGPQIVLDTLSTLRSYYLSRDKTRQPREKKEMIILSTNLGGKPRIPLGYKKLATQAYNYLRQEPGFEDTDARYIIGRCLILANLIDQWTIKMSEKYNGSLRDYCRRATDRYIHEPYLIPPQT